MGGNKNGILAVFIARSFCKAKTSSKALDTTPSMASKAVGYVEVL